MRTVSHVFQNSKTFASFLKKNSIPKNSVEVLLQVFTGKPDKKYVESLRKTLVSLLPKASIIGATTAGEIYESEILENKTVISVTVFEKTRLKTVAISHRSGKDQSFSTGQTVAKKIVTPSTKVIICFGEGISTNGEDLMKGIEKENPKIIVSGGLAGDNMKLKQTYVFTEKKVISRGVVAVALCNSSLIVNTAYNFDWKNIGKQLTITKAEKNRLYEIDHTPIVEIYRKYLGDAVANRLPVAGIEFPLVLNRNNIKIARAVLVKNKDKSLSLAGNVDEGEKVQFGYGNVEMILHSSRKLHRKFQSCPIESIFIYSCCARQIFMGSSIVRETAPLSQLAPTTGFFTYGEFLHGENANELLNETMTVLAISENKRVNKNKIKVDSVINEKKSESLVTLDTLSHLTEVVTDELTDLKNHLQDKIEGQTKKLQKSYDKLEKLDKLKDVFISTASHELRTPMTIIKGYGEFLLSKKFGNLNDKQKNFIERIVKNTNHLLDLISDILDIGKLERGHMEFHFSKVDLKKILQDEFVKNPVPRSSLRIRECPRCARIRSMLRSSLEHRASAKIQRVSVD